MSWAIRSIALAAGAAALLSSQAVYAAPMPRAPAIDPLVSLSVFGTAQSRAAVCAAGTAAAAAGAAVASAAQVPPPGCLLPLTGAPPPPAVQAVPPEPVVPLAAPGKAKDWTTLALIGAGLLAIIIAAVLILDDDDDGELIPISP